MSKLQLRWKKTVSLVMILALIQIGVLGSGIPVLAESEETVSNAVYQNSNLTNEVSETVYGDEDQRPVLPPPLIFLQGTLLDQVSATSGIFTVSGQVYENSTGMPLVGVTVQLLLDGYLTQFSTSTDSQGSYYLTGVGPGQYQLTFQHPGYAPENFGLDVSGADVMQNCNLLRNGSLKGRVVNELGDSLEGAQVTIADQNIPDRDFQLYTDINGWFNLTEVPPGRYQLSVSQSVYHQQAMVWVDEYPQELTMVLRGIEPFPSTVVEEVYVENPAQDNGQAGESGEVDSDLPNADDGVNETPNDGSEVNSDTPNVGNESNEMLNKDAEANIDIPNVEKVENLFYSEKAVNTGVPSSVPGKNQPYQRFNVWSAEFLALREHDPLNELDKLLKKQAVVD